MVRFVQLCFAHHNGRSCILGWMQFHWEELRLPATVRLGAKGVGWWRYLTPNQFLSSFPLHHWCGWSLSPTSTVVCSTSSASVFISVQWILNELNKLLWATSLASTVIADAPSGIPQLSSVISQCKPCHIPNSTQLNSAFQFNAISVTELNSTQLNAAQLNIPV